MSEFNENYGNEHAGLDENPDMKKDADSPKKKLSVNASARANQIVKNRYHFPQMDLGGKKSYYDIESRSTSFDRILRRTPREVYRDREDYVGPLGTTCMETVICAYGLSYGYIYTDEHWFDLLGKFNDDKSVENAEKVVDYLRAAATLKYLNVSGATIHSDHPVQFAQNIQSVNVYDIISFFCYMVR